MRDGCNIDEVGKRLENAVMSLPHISDQPKDLYDQYEGIAIEILDSEFDSYPEGVLEQYLSVHLYCLSKELGLSEIV
ncbi:MAG: hypothetical protein HOE44_06815 [Candidatus Marinimicrobia bacterium]|jgi:hypothetical protein|nr:hypothetical protein [Candidatus Neomarinimicrobiota bacterium]